MAAVIFALDGVLVDSEPLHLRATRTALGPRGGSYSDRDHRAFVGETDVEVLRVLRILWNVAEPTSALVAARTGHLVALIRAEARPMPGVPAVPLALREAGFAMGLVSASSGPVIEAALETLGLTGCFDAIVSGDEVVRGTRGPDGLLMTARRLGVASPRCLVVEGSRTGVLAAKAAGMRVAAIPGPPTRDGDVSLADLVLPGLDGLAKALESLRPARGRPAV